MPVDSAMLSRRFKSPCTYLALRHVRSKIVYVYFYLSHSISYSLLIILILLSRYYSVFPLICNFFFFS
ncbi:hypothetical protein PUN28_002816 [Cardiocondyla obscurior]|uniref:Uncharacterized protein n=1 Tax=Cardiocondyla obscurior TaxID=286306 RepID=A0AAW2GWH9_9HYME